MGEEEKKSEEKKPEEPKQEEEAKPAENPDESKNDAKESKAEEAAPPPPAPPEIVLQVFMHCEGCARKVRRSLKGFPGVEDVITDCKSHNVVVKGDKADPLKVLERVQKKSHRQVKLLSPIPKPPEEKKLPEPEAKPESESEEKKEEPQIVTVILKVHMHCEACAQEMKRRIQRMKGVESVEPDLKNSQVTVEGVYDPAMLVEYVHKRFGKHAVIVKQEPEKKEKAEEDKEEKRMEEGEKESEGEENKEKKNEVEENKEKKEDEDKEGDEKPEKEEAVATEETNKVTDMKKNEYYYTPQRYGMDLYAYPAHSAYYQYHAYPPQMFSDENPNACSVM